ncbi:hypothetical protein GCM10017774_37870 [Lentzea cavernae]|uniref:Uncharacterized protein n=1 Tax=Lentzea cavernae TaxID=2020703 RepID=A0ABQ3MG22_9PSEU|nr:hypothetical protein GCM10017774_37870 [Lentzea cavernae]
MIADALGFHSKHVTPIWADAGGVWKTYTPWRSQPVRFTVEYQLLDQWILPASRANSCGAEEAENARVYPQPNRTICLGQVQPRLRPVIGSGRGEPFVPVQHRQPAGVL